MSHQPRKPNRTSGRSMSLRRAATKVVTDLQQAGHVAYWAGGCVRDEVLGLEPSDYDVATDARPEQVRQLFPRSRAVGESFGVVLVNLARHRIEVATFRTEWGYSDHRRPDGVTFSDAQHDAQRRDFTINGLFKDPVTNKVIDYVGGIDDLNAGIIRAIGEPRKRLEEDHLRALRAVRFAARFGYDIDPETAQEIRRTAAALSGVSRERIGLELEQMLTDMTRADAVCWMQQLALDAPVLTEPTNARTPTTLASLGEHRVAFGVALAAWALDRGVADDPQLDRRWRAAMKLSNHHQRLLGAILRDLPVLQSHWPNLAVPARKRLAAQSHFRHTLQLLTAVNSRQAGAISRDIKMLAAHAGGLAPTPLLDGKALIEMGMMPGPDFKQILDAVYDAQLDGEVTDAQQALSLARHLTGLSDDKSNQ
ncbi:MAG: CCA tRNA nucleotidyltransferase [Planctomycetes bacterium]|nr:CCA tRNA nucleotidyltransferase [Planctomycetota bacterium]NOG54396.1 CCA tRNA nucleotidyltransferase [Planctomycetota bacterium]